MSFGGFSRGIGSAVRNTQYYLSRTVRSTPFRLLLAVLLVFGTVNTWGFSGYSWIEKNIEQYFRGWGLTELVNISGMLGAAAVVWIVLWATCSATWRNRLFTAYFGMAVLVSGALIVSYTEWLQLVIAAFKVTLFAIAWMLLLQTSMQLMGRKLFTLFALCVAFGTIAAYAGLNKSFGVPITWHTLVWTGQVGVSFLLMGGMLFPSIRKSFLGLSSVMTPDRTTVAGGNDGAHSVGDGHGDTAVADNSVVGDTHH